MKEGLIVLVETVEFAHQMKKSRLVKSSNFRFDIDPGGFGFLAFG